MRVLLVASISTVKCSSQGYSYSSFIENATALDSTSYSYSSASCTSGCSDEVLSAIGEQDAFCAIDDLSCVSGCLSLNLVDAHCECGTGALFASYSFDFLGTEEYCCGSTACQTAVKDALVALGSLSDADAEAQLSESCATVECSSVGYTYSFSTVKGFAEGSTPYSYSSASCTSGCSDEVLSAIGDQGAFCAIDDLSCMLDC